MGQSPKLEFGELLKQHRQARAWSQVELARKVDLSSSYISKLERNDRPPPRSTARTLAVAFGLSDEQEKDFLVAASRARARHSDSRGQRETARLLARLPALPQRVRSTVGRDEEIRDIIDRLADPGEVINITGEPAIGKTTVALEVAHHYLDQGRAVLWGDAREGTAETVGQVESLLWLSVVGGRIPDNERQRQKRLSAALSEHEPLVVLDNLESAREFDGILDFSKQIGKGASVLITSRRGIDAHYGDNLYLSELPGEKGIQLFEKVGGAYGRLALTEKDRRAIEFICVDTLQGHPGAIEIAASLWKGWPLEAILRGLRQRAMEVLEDPLRLDINRSMRISIGLSYDLLHEENTKAWVLLPRLAVFQGSFSHQAVAVVAGTSDVLPLLGFLVDRSLVRFDGRRHSLHSLVREFGLDRLGEARVEHELAAADYYLQFAQKHMSDFERLDGEKGNLFATMDWAEAHREHRGIALAMAQLLDEFMERRGLWAERVRRLQRALEVAELIEDEEETVLLRYLLGNASRSQEDHEGAQGNFRKGLALARQLGDADYIAAGLFLLALSAFDAESYLEARDLCDQAYTIWTETGVVDEVPRAISLLASCELELGKPEQAYVLLEKGLALARQLGNTPLIGLLLGDLFDLDIETQDFGRAEEHLQEYEKFARQTGDALDRGVALRFRGRLLRETSCPEEAVSYFFAAASHFEQSGLPMEAVEARGQLALAAEQLTDFPLAEEQLEAIVLTYVQLGDYERAATGYYWLGCVQEALSKPGDAAQSYGQALLLYHSLGKLDDPTAEEAAQRLEGLSERLAASEER